MADCSKCIHIDVCGKLIFFGRNCNKECVHYKDGSDLTEVVHGRWIAVPSSDMMTGKAYKCSECGKMRYGSFMPNYCQNCGAKMDGGENG